MTMVTMIQDDNDNRLYIPLTRDLVFARRTTTSAALPTTQRLPSRFICYYYKYIFFYVFFFLILFNDGQKKWN